MTFSKLTWHKRTHGHRFTGAEFRVLMSIFDHSSADGTNSHPGIKRMMAETGYGKAAVSSAVTGLKARGWIRETRKGSGVSGNASVFELVPGAPQPPSSSPVGEQLTQASSSPGVEQPSEVVRLERTSSSPGVNQVVRLEQSLDYQIQDQILSHQIKERFGIHRTILRSRTRPATGAGLLRLREEQRHPKKVPMVGARKAPPCPNLQPGTDHTGGPMIRSPMRANDMTHARCALVRHLLNRCLRRSGHPSGHLPLRIGHAHSQSVSKR
jgi:hypothetical protein